MMFLKDHKLPLLYRWICCLAVLVATFMCTSAAQADKKELAAVNNNTAVIFVYQRVGEDSVPQSSLSLEQFQEHMRELSVNGYSVLPLEKIVDLLKDPDKKLPKKTVALTFDGAYTTTLHNILPILEEAQFPFTVFFSSDMADGGTPGHMNWSDIKTLKKNKLATIGLLPATYARMTNKSADENTALINKAIARFRDNLETDALFLAYPYGEYSKELKKQVEQYKFKAIFGQQSGAISPDSDFMALPRFTMTNEFGDLDRFLLTANALPLNVTDVVPDDPVVTENPPLIGFTLDPSYKDTSKLSCFASGLGKVALTRLGNNRIEIRLPTPLTDRHTRINCTMPDSSIIPGEAQRWRWFGMLLILPNIKDDDTNGTDGSLDTDDTNSNPEN